MSRLSLRARLMIIGVSGLAVALLVGGLSLVVALRFAVDRGTDAAARATAEQVAAMVAACRAAYGRIDVLVNNVGGSAAGGPVELAEDAWDAQIDYNLKSVFLACKHAIPVMVEQGGGSIVNTSSMAALVAFTGLPAYTASKGGVAMLTKLTAAEYAARGVRVNAILPGAIDTGMTRGMPKAYIDGAVAANLAWWVDGPGQDAGRVDPAVRDLVARMQRRAFELTAGWDDVEEAELDPPAGHLVDLRHLDRQQTGLAERRGRHQCAEPDGRGLAGQPRQRQVRVGGAWQAVPGPHRQEVVGPEERREAALLGLPRHREQVVVRGALLGLGEDAEVHARTVPSGSDRHLRHRHVGWTA